MDITDGDDQRCDPPTEEELKWLKNLEKMLMSCPSKRLECWTMGDQNLTFYDKNLYEEQDAKYGTYGSPDVGGVVTASGSFSISINAPFGIVGGCG